MADNLVLNHLQGKNGKNFLKESYTLLKVDKLCERENNDPIAEINVRNDFHRDYTRILYSSSFRRLQGKMQILGVQSDAFFRNRLTHSLEVSQIARFIASQIGLVIGDNAYGSNNDLYVIEAAALAHDIGHPAFGHSGERVLDRLCSKCRFEGNAQNYRVLRTLEKKLPKFNGLNLTKRTLLAVNKYLISEESGKDFKKFMYKDDYKALQDIRQITGLNGRRTLDAQIIDLADEIAYAVHDLEDALSLGFFNIDEFCYLLKKNMSCPSSLEDFVKVVKTAKTDAKQSESYETIQEYSQVFRKSLISRLTHMFITDVGVRDVDNEFKRKHGLLVDQELGFINHKELIGAIKDITYDCINRSDAIALYENRGKVVIEGLYEMFTDIGYNSNYNLLPPDYRPKKDEDLPRAVIDYIAGMMDTYAISLYEKHFGVSFDAIKYKKRGNMDLSNFHLEADCVIKSNK